MSELASNAEIIQWLKERRFGQQWSVARLSETTGVKPYMIRDALDGTIWKPLRARMTRIMALPERSLPKVEKERAALYEDGKLAWDYARILWNRHRMKTPFSAAQLFDADKEGQRRMRWWTEWALKRAILQQYESVLNRVTLWDALTPREWEDRCRLQLKQSRSTAGDLLPRPIMPVGFQPLKAPEGPASFSSTESAPESTTTAP